MNKHQNGTATHTPSRSGALSGFSGRRFSFQHDVTEVLSLYEDVFGRSAGQDLWKWKYQPPWIQESYAWIGRHDEQVIGYIGAIPLRGLLNGEQVFFFQFGDIMVSPGFRSMADYLRWTPKKLIEEIRSEYPRAFLYGFTSRKLARFYTWYVSSVRNTHVECTDDYIVQSLAQELDQSECEEIHIENWSWDASELDGLWQQHKDTVRVGLIRDRAYLDWRYAKHPTIEYDLLGVYHREVPVGWLVTGKRPVSEQWDDEVRIHDMLIPQEMRVSVLQKAASICHAKSAVLWMPAHCVEPGMVSRKTNWQTIYHPLNDTVSKEFLAANIYYTLGEADEWWW